MAVAVNNNDGIVDNVNTDPINIWSKQETINKRFASISITEIDEMEIHIFTY